MQSILRLSVCLSSCSAAEEGLGKSSSFEVCLLLDYGISVGFFEHSPPKPSSSDQARTGRKINFNDLIALGDLD